MPYVVRLWMSLFPLNEDELGDNQGDNEDQYHLCVHGLVALVFGVHSRMLHSNGKRCTSLLHSKEEHYP